jgi:tripartite-type tricarboxylate transporter receptor subunit TctC
MAQRFVPWACARALLAVGLALIAPCAEAQDDFPSRPVRMLVPFPPGGVTDILARLIAPKMGEGLKQNVVIDNRPGANGNIAVETVAKSSPDGYTLLFGQVSNVAINPAIYPNLTFDTQRDLAPVALVASAPQLMVVSATSNYKSVADVLAAAKAKPGEVTFASSGNGSMAHMGLELMQLSAGIKFLHIPYKGAAPAVIDVIGGRADVFMAAVPSVAGQMRAGKLKAVAVTSATRTADMPEIPTLAESGFPGFEASNWFAVMGRAGTAPTIIARLNTEVNRALQADDVKARVAAEGGTVLGGSPVRLADQLAADLAKWRRVVKEAGIKLE